MGVVYHTFFILLHISTVQHLMRDFNDSLMKTANMINITLWHEVMDIADDNIQQKVSAQFVECILCYSLCSFQLTSVNAWSVNLII
jgi:hypothetical protein